MGSPGLCVAKVTETKKLTLCLPSVCYANVSQIPCVEKILLGEEWKEGGSEK
jgi:hypothetical protein